MRVMRWGTVAAIVAGAMGRAAAQAANAPDTGSSTATAWRPDAGAGVVAIQGSTIHAIQIGALAPLRDPHNQLRVAIEYAWGGNSTLPQALEFGCLTSIACGEQAQDNLLAATVAFRHYLDPEMGRSGAFFTGSAGLYVSKLVATYSVTDVSVGYDSTWSRTWSRLALGIGPGIGVAGSLAGMPLFAELDVVFLTADRGRGSGSVVMPVTIGVRF